MNYCPIPSEQCVKHLKTNFFFSSYGPPRVPRKIVSRATLGTRAIGSPALVYVIYILCLIIYHPETFQVFREFNQQYDSSTP